MFGKKSKIKKIENKRLNKNKFVFYVFIFVFSDNFQKLNSNVNDCLIFYHYLKSFSLLLLISSHFIMNVLERERERERQRWHPTHQETSNSKRQFFIASTKNHVQCRNRN